MRRNRAKPSAATRFTKRRRSQSDARQLPRATDRISAVAGGDRGSRRYAQEHRLELLGELIGMVERWKAAGMPMAAVRSRFNKRGWGNIVGGILAVCGEPDFLANAQEVATQLDDTRREFAELVAVMADDPQGLWTAAELTELATRCGLLKLEVGEGSPRSQATRIGVIAGRFVAERFELSDERSAVFHRSEDRKGKLYRVEIAEMGAEVPNV
jgi:hypothetical protein